MSGGGVYNHLDFSFTPDHPDGIAVPLAPGTPGGGGPELRRQLAILKRFLSGFDLVRMAPRHDLLVGHRIRPASDVRTQSAPPVLADTGKAYAIYVDGGNACELQLTLPVGSFSVEWVNTKSGEVEKRETFSHPGGVRTLSSPDYEEDIALRVQRM